LRERGIGVQHAYDEWRAIAPEHPTILLDDTTARTPKQARLRIEEFFSHDAAVLVGTSYALTYLNQPVTSSVVVSYDATRTIPSWRADEVTFRLLLRLREQSDRDVLVQTRSAPDSILEHASSGSLEHFYNDELQLREQLHYPPFRTLILLTWIHTEQTAQLESRLETELSTLSPRFYPNPHNTGVQELRHCLLKSVAGKAHEQVLAVLRQLPPYVKIEINPDRIV
jgi:primosomal protein N'